MALKAGRVGVAKDQVDEFGNIIGGSTPENVYTKTQCDNKFETKTHASNTYETKENIGGLKFRDNDGTAQYQLPNGEWTNFNSGGSGIGFNIPSELLRLDAIPRSTLTILSGGYAVVDNLLYVDMVISDTSGTTSGELVTIPLPEGSPVCNNTSFTELYTDVVNSYKAGAVIARLNNIKVRIGSYNDGFLANTPIRFYGQFVINVG